MAKIHKRNTRLNPNEIKVRREWEMKELEYSHFGMSSVKYEDLLYEQFRKLEKELEDELISYGEPKDRYKYIHFSYKHEELIALSEMFIVYAYKDFEIQLKLLLCSAYNLESNYMYKWDFIKKFIENRGILPKSIIGYNEVDQMREVNNAIKHGFDMKNSKILKIPEFRDSENLEYNQLIKFFRRVKSYPVKFISGLAKLIHDDLYSFSDDKLDQLALSFALRMDKEVAYKFIENIKSNY